MQKRTNPLGSILNKALLILRLAENLSWNLKAVDDMDQDIPVEERKKVNRSANT